MKGNIPVNSDGLDVLLKQCESSVRYHALRALGLWGISESSLIELRPKAKTLLEQLAAPSFGTWLYLLIDIREASKKASKSSLKSANQFTSTEWETIWSAWRHDITPEHMTKLKLALNGLNLAGIETLEKCNICALADVTRKIRNYYSHHPCTIKWIQQATGAMEVIHAELVPALEVKKDMPGVVEPWFFIAKDGEIFSYVHCTENGTPVYYGKTGDANPRRDKEDCFFSAFKQLIGKPLTKEDIQKQLRHRTEQLPGIILGDFLLISG